jgi:hypothetical protein
MLITTVGIKTKYTLRLTLLLPRPDGSGFLTAHGSRLTAHGSRLTAHGSHYTLIKRRRVKYLTPKFLISPLNFLIRQKTASNSDKNSPTPPISGSPAVQAAVETYLFGFGASGKTARFAVQVGNGGKKGSAVASRFRDKGERA